MERQYKIIPIVDLREKGYPWVDEFVSKVNATVQKIDDQMKTEAYSDGIHYFTQYDFLYERFLDNVEHGLVKGNWQVFKYFVRHLRKKCYNHMIGKYTFKRTDFEMFDHFNSLPLDEEHHCFPRYVKYKTVEKSYYEPSDTWSYYSGLSGNFAFQYTVKNGLYSSLLYSMPTALYTQCFDNINALISKVQLYPVDNEPVFNKDILEPIIDCKIKYSDAKILHY